MPKPKTPKSEPASVPKDAEFLDAPVSLLPSVAAKRQKLLEKLSVYTISDLLSYFPRDYVDWTDVTPIADLRDKEVMSFQAVVRRKPSLLRKGHMSMLSTVLSDPTGTIRVTWFNQPYLEKRLEKGETFCFRGKIRRDGSVFDVTNPAIQAAKEGVTPEILPLYPLTKGLSQGVLRQVIASATEKGVPLIPEVLPPAILAAESLCDVGYAYEMIHRPTSWEAERKARERLVYEELFLVQGGLRYMKNKKRGVEKSYRILIGETEKKRMASVVHALPFELTQDQNKVITAILQDMKKESPMNRLIQGDVGSGKTVVAAVSILACALCGKQSVLLAPTSILAAQHAATLGRLFAPAGIAVALLLGSTSAAEKKRIRTGLANGQIAVLVGTHAVLSEKICFDALALTVTDEQHRFGVRQRATFLDREMRSPHTLVMSATPIPRTLALILYGDLDISVIRSIPAGRIPIETYTASYAEEERVFALVRKQLDEGRQVYFVCPTIDEETHLDEDFSDESEPGMISATALFERLRTEVFPAEGVGLLHGGLRSSDKDLVMRRFIEGESKILVCTTVVEVGVDNPNATLMVIENAERFGLSQLHQLRGRVGRGQHRSVCVLMSDKRSGVSGERLKTLCKTTDGFQIARKDLELRGPGDFFGTRQHGIPALRIANLYRDTDVLSRVTLALDDIYAEDPLLELPSHRNLPEAFLRRFGNRLEHPSL